MGNTVGLLLNLFTWCTCFVLDRVWQLCVFGICIWVSLKGISEFSDGITCCLFIRMVFVYLPGLIWMDSFFTSFTCWKSSVYASTIGTLGGSAWYEFFLYLESFP